MRPGLRATEFWLAVIFLIIAGAVLWKYGPAAGSSLSGLSYPVTGYGLARTALKRKHVR
jgi:hypothetical protein